MGVDVEVAAAGVLLELSVLELVLSELDVPSDLAVELLELAGALDLRLSVT